MGKNKYSNVGKKQIINVLNEVIRKVQIIEYTLNAYIEYLIHVYTILNAYIEHFDII